MKTSVILACAGLGSRTGLGYNKLRFDIGGMPLVQKTISCFFRSDINNIIISCSKDDFTWFQELVKDLDSRISLCIGGATRQESVANALNSVPKDTDYVIIHDGARPFVTQDIINEALACAYKNGNAIVCTESIDSMRIIDDTDSVPISRDTCVRVQTPQIFKYESIIEAYKKAAKSNKVFLDDASLYQKYFGKIFMSQGSSKNIKITTKEDLDIFLPNRCYVGVGWDTHELVENRKLILGGIKIEHSKGLLGHSDADVLVHAIMDSLLSATNNKDIGQLFPDTNEKYEGISSLILLDEVVKLIVSQGFTIGNVSAVVLAQRPKLANFIPQMELKLAQVMQIDPTKVTISATTTEKLGLVGREEAISANAYCVVYKE